MNHHLLMCSKISLFPNEQNDYDYYFYNDSIHLFSENPELDEVENPEEAELTSHNENDKGNSENSPNLTSDNKEKEFPKVLVPSKSKDKNLININQMKISTKPASDTFDNGGLEKDNNKAKQIILIAPNKKRVRTKDEFGKKNNDRGNHKKNFLPKIKTHFFRDLHDWLITPAIKKSDFCINNNIKLNKIKDDVFLISKASENLEFLNTKLSDVYSKHDKENENAIKLIIQNGVQNAFLNVILNKTILQLINIYVKKDEIKNNSYKNFRDSYLRLKIDLQYMKQKTPEYISNFDYYSKNIEEVYKAMNENPKPKRRKK